jgi:hypothetical protein
MLRRLFRGAPTIGLFQRRHVQIRSHPIRWYGIEHLEDVGAESTHAEQARVPKRLLPPMLHAWAAESVAEPSPNSA